MIVLGLESSCDETAAAVVRGGREVLSSVVSSQYELHAEYAGVVPEIASRAHVERVVPVMREALERAGVGLGMIDAVAVGNRPGLIGCLLVGVGAAKALSWSLAKPLIGVDHVHAHLYSGMLDRQEDGSIFPALGLVVSGGHTALFHLDSWNQVKRLGGTIDDAAGEAFDKIARILELGFPGGPAIDREAKTGNPDAIEFPRGLTLARDLINHKYDFSFSGLKTAVSRYLAKTPSYLRADVAASFQEAVVDVLLTKAIGAAKATGIETLIIAGGVAANSRLRDLASQRTTKAGIQLRIPPMDLCTDNGAMVAAIGSLAVAKGLKPSQIGFAADSSSGISKPIF